MSKVSDSVASSGDVATTYNGDTGSATPSGNVLNTTSGTSTADNDNGLTSFNSGNTVNYRLTNRLSGSASSAAAANADVITFDLGGSFAVYRFDIDVAGKCSNLSQGVGYNIIGSARTNGTIATIIATPEIDDDEDTDLVDCEIDLIASGNTVIVRANGVAGQTVEYKAVGSYVKV